MPYKPFLSHKHEDSEDLALLRSQLTLRGAGGWQDVDDLRVGQRWRAAFVRAIGRETGGFIWWGTRASLGSSTITKIEMPAALTRTRSRRRSPYPLVPLFVDLEPYEDTDALDRAFGRRRTKQLLALQGLVRDRAETLSEFGARAARRYVRDLIREHKTPSLRIAITGAREPSAEHDLYLDWRPLLSDGRLIDATSVAKLTETLTDIRTAAQSVAGCPHFVLEPHLRLPLAALVGWEWNRVWPIRLTVMQPSANGLMEVRDTVAQPRIWPTPITQSLSGAGPAVLAVSVGKDLGDTVDRYAVSHDACETEHLHVDLGGYTDQSLGSDEICSLAQWVVERLAALNARGLEKHLLLLGPASLAVRIGAGANGTGRTFVPFWDGDTGYTSGISIGLSPATAS